MKFLHSSGIPDIKSNKNDRRSKGLSANIRQVTGTNNLTITIEPGDNPKSILSTAGRVLGAGCYKVSELPKSRATSPVKYLISTN